MAVLGFAREWDRVKLEMLREQDGKPRDFFLAQAPSSWYSRRSPESESTTKHCTRQERWQRRETKMKLTTQMMSARK